MSRTRAQRRGGADPSSDTFILIDTSRSVKEGVGDVPVQNQRCRIKPRLPREKRIVGACRFAARQRDRRLMGRNHPCCARLHRRFACWNTHSPRHDSDGPGEIQWRGLRRPRLLSAKQPEIDRIFRQNSENHLAS